MPAVDRVDRVVHHAAPSLRALAEGADLAEATAALYAFVFQSVTAVRARACAGIEERDEREHGHEAAAPTRALISHHPSSVTGTPWTHRPSCVTAAHVNAEPGLRAGARARREAERLRRGRSAPAWKVCTRAHSATGKPS